MRTKQTNPIRLFLPLIVFCISLCLSADSKAQNDFNSSTTNPFFGGIQTLNKNPWSVINNPSLAIPDHQFTYGVGWTGILVGSGLHAFSAAAQVRIKNAGLGFQLNRIGYEISNFNQMTFSLAQNWNERISSGLSVKLSAHHVQGEPTLTQTPNIILGTNLKFEHVFLTFVVHNPIPDKTIGISAFRMTTGLEYHLNPNTNLFVESTFSIQQNASLTVAVERKIATQLKIYLGISPSPASMCFGLNLDLGKKKSLLAANLIHFRYSNYPSLAFMKQ